MRDLYIKIPHYYECMSSTNNFFLFLLFLMLLDAACSNKKQVPTPISLEPVKSLSEPNDSTLIADVWAMEFANNRLYFADNLDQILQFRPDLQLFGRIKKSGKGPGEFTGVLDMSFVNDSLYLYDDSQAKVLIYDHKNNFIREIGLPEASGSDMVVDNHSHVFLSTPNRKYPITKFNADGHKVMAFGRNAVSKDSKYFLRNSRFLFIHNDKLIAISRSEPLLELYSLEGKFIRKVKIAPPEAHDLIARVKKENEGPGEHPNITSLSNLFVDAAIYKNSIYLMEAKRTNEGTNTYDTKFTYLFKYKLESDGDVIFERTFKLFRSDRDKLMYGFRLAAIGDHKLVVYDLMGKNLLVFEDKRL